jgi:hypothetical protein
MSASESPDFVQLRDGIMVALPAVLLALDLEARGVRLKVDDGELLVGPSGLITNADREAIRRWRMHLLHVVGAASSLH